MNSKIVNQRLLTADEGMYLTNGEVAKSTVVLPLDEDASVWQEITEAEAQEILNKQEEETNV